MPRTQGYVGRESKNGEFSCHIKGEINRMLDIYCKVNGKNKTAFVNEVIAEKMSDAFLKLKEEEES